MKQTWTIAAAALLALSACTKKDDPNKAATGAPPGPPAVAPITAPATSPAGSAPAAVDAGPTEAERVAEGLKKAEAEATEEKLRWTPALTQQAVALRDGTFADAKAALAAALAGPHRLAVHEARDGSRHPVETLSFFGVTPTMTVIEVGAGGGYYTELLAPLLAARGRYLVAGPAANGPADKMSTVYGRRLDLFLGKSPELFGKTERLTIGAPPIKLGEDGKADLVIAMREMHNWQRRGELDAYLAGIHAALEPGGTFGVEQHRGVAGTKGEDTAESGYLSEDWVIGKVTGAGFALVAKSELNANPKDTKDYPKGVWTLPPNFREGDKDRAKYEAIGESDRMTLRFRKK